MCKAVIILSILTVILRLFVRPEGNLVECGTAMTMAICVVMAVKAVGDTMTGCADPDAGWPAILVLALLNIKTIYVLSVQAKEDGQEKLWKRTKAFMHIVGKVERPSRGNAPEGAKDS